MPEFQCPKYLDKYRVVHPLANSKGDATHGALQIKAHGLRVLFSAFGGWEHVSVSRQSRMPSWQDMDWVKRQFWSDDCTVMQLHVPPADHIDCHPYCLHLWRPSDNGIPRPPHYMVSNDERQETALNLPAAFVMEHCPEPGTLFQGERLDRFTREELLAVVGYLFSGREEYRRQSLQRRHDLLSGEDG